MSQDCTVGVYDSFKDASEAIRALDEAGFPHDQVSFVTFRVEDQLEQPAAVQSGDEAEKATAVGAASGGLLGLLLGAPMLTVPGVGAAIVAGPIAAMGLTGAVVGGLLGSMTGWGVHEDHLKRYQGYVDDGKLLVVATGNPLEVANAMEAMKSTNTIELNTHADMSADAIDVRDSSAPRDGIIIAPDHEGNI